jgi:hypothetical protein
MHSWPQQYIDTHIEEIYRNFEQIKLERLAMSTTSETNEVSRSARFRQRLFSILKWIASFSKVSKDSSQIDHRSTQQMPSIST